MFANQWLTLRALLFKMTSVSWMRKGHSRCRCFWVQAKILECLSSSLNMRSAGQLAKHFHTSYLIRSPQLLSEIGWTGITASSLQTGSEPKSLACDHMANEGQGDSWTQNLICQVWGYFCYFTGVFDNTCYHHQNEKDRGWNKQISKETKGFWWFFFKRKKEICRRRDMVFCPLLLSWH